MGNTATKITTYATQLDKVRDQMEELKIKETDIIAKIIDLTGVPYSTGNKTIPNKTTKVKGGSLGDTIINFLNSNPGSNLQTMATKLKMEAKQIGLSLYHLTKANKVVTKDGNYYISTSLATAAKTIPNTNEDEEETPF